MAFRLPSSCPAICHCHRHRHGLAQALALYGPACSGKSVAAAAVAAHLRSEGVPVAAHFCNVSDVRCACRSVRQLILGLDEPLIEACRVEMDHSVGQATYWPSGPGRKPSTSGQQALPPVAPPLDLQ